MRSRIFLAIPVLLAFVIAIFISLTPTQAELAAGSKALKVGVADLSKIVDESVRKVDDEAALKEMIGNANKQIEALREQIHALDVLIAEKSEILSPDSEELTKMRFERDVKKLRLEHMIKSTQKHLNRGKTNILANIYSDFKTVSDAYAKKYGYDLILAKNQLNLKTSDYENLMLQISMQSVYAYPLFSLPLSLFSY